MAERIVTGQRLSLGEDALRKMQRAARDLVEPALALHETVREQAKLDWEWYEAKPFVPVRNRPFQNASNIVYPLIGTHADSLQARRFLSLFPTKNVWTSSSGDEAVVKGANELVKFWNEEADDNAFDFRTPSNDGLLESTVTGRGVLALQWGRRVKSRFFGGKARPVQLHNGIHVFNVPISQICWQAGRSLRESEYVIRSSFMTPGELVAATNAPPLGAGWDKAAVESVLKARPQSRAWAEVMSGMDMIPMGPEAFQPLEILELNVEWPLMRGYNVAAIEEDQFQTRPALTVYLDRDTFEILHVMAYPYPIQSWAFYELSYRRTGQPGGSRGVAKDLEHMQAGISTMLNQAVDSITWSNRILGLTEDESLVGKTFADGLVYTTAGIERTRFDLKPQPFVQPEVAIIQLLLAASERKTGMSDPNFGRESRSGGHPAPATSTVALLKQGQIVLARTLAFDRIEFSRFAEDGLALYQAFEAQQNPGNRIERVVGIGDAQVVKQILFPGDPISGLVGIDIRAASETDSEEALFQRAIQVDQVLTNYYAKVIQGLNVAMQALQAPPPFSEFILKTAFSTLQGVTASVERILSAANVDDPEVFIEQLRGAITEGTAGALQAVQQQAALALQAAQQQQPGAGNPAAGPPVQTAPGGLPATAPGPAAGPGR